MSISSGTPPDAIPPLTVKGSRLLGLKLGVPLRAVVEGTTENGWLLRVGGYRFEARSSRSLLRGERLNVVASRSGSGIFLRVVEKTSGLESAGIRVQLGLPDNDVAAAVIRAAVRSGLGLKSDRIRAIYRFVDAMRRSAKARSELSRFASLMGSKGIDLDAALAELIVGEAGSQAGSHQRHEGERGGRDKPGRHDLIDVVRDAFRAAPVATHPLQLFNHLVGQGDHWIVVPLSAVLGSQTITGSIRILVPRGRAITGEGATFRYAVIALRDGENDRFFRLSPIENRGEASRSLRDVPSTRAEAHLRSRMEELGYLMTIVDEADEVFDGFSWDLEGDIMKPVNSSA